MAAIPPSTEQEIINRMYKSIEDANKKNSIYLGRIGASSIGNECLRAIWLDWRAYARVSHSGRILRLFGTGHHQEHRVLGDLRAAGFKVWDRDKHGNQFEFTHASGHFVTKLDGIIKDVPNNSDNPHVLEIKTHNRKSFESLQKKRLREAKPEHYAQVQASMKLANLTRAIYIAICKDDEQYYVERVKEDKTEQARLEQRVIKLIDARLRPAGVSEDGSSFSCKWCDMRAVCVREQPALKTCRSCRHAVPSENGTWTCTEHDKPLLTQMELCDSYEEL